MDILQVVPRVIATSHTTLEQALAAFFGSSITTGDEVLQEQLSLQRFLGKIAPRPIGLVTIKDDTSVREFLAGMAAQGYEPAGFDESLEYLKRLLELKVRCGSVFHLGTPLHNERTHIEYRLLLRERGLKPELVPYVPGATRLKKGYTVVVARALSTSKGYAPKPK